MHKAKKEREGRKKKEESSKTNDGENRKEMKKDNEGKSPVKRPAVRTEDSDIDCKHFNQEGPITVASGMKESGFVALLIIIYCLLVLIFLYFQSLKMMMKKVNPPKVNTDVELPKIINEINCNIMSV